MGRGRELYRRGCHQKAENTKGIGAFSTAEPATHKPADLGHTTTNEETSRAAHTTGLRLKGPAEKEMTHKSRVHNRNRRDPTAEVKGGQAELHDYDTS